jgi:hypothetical protein
MYYHHYERHYYLGIEKTEFMRKQNLKKNWSILLWPLERS